nr:ATP-dependent DNA helicase RecQ-like [Misgurnus anguillicaudatus]
MTLRLCARLSCSSVMAAGKDASNAIRSVVATQSNIKNLQPEQEQALLSFVSGHDVMALLPTGFVKSLIFQLATLVVKEMAKASGAKPIVVVVSPLVALLEDQVKEAEKLGVRAGQLGVHDDRDILEGRLSLVFGSPESWLLNNKWRRMLASTVYHDNLVGIVVDEVHVTYKWGEAVKGESAFQDSFAKLGELRSITKEGTPVLALTASADIKSRSRVIRLLHMDNAVQIIASPNKTNIPLGLCKVPNHQMNCLDWIDCETLRSVGRVFSYLKAELQGHAWVGCDPDCRSDNLLIGMFHSKTLPQNKERVLASLRGEGNCRVVVATTALGMGLNFPSVSHVVMYGPPGDLESILQQVGRAGGMVSHHMTSYTTLDSISRWMKR